MLMDIYLASDNEVACLCYETVIDLATVTCQLHTW